MIPAPAATPKEVEMRLIREGATDDHESLSQMDFSTIVDATENFSHQIGKGGFGNVYKVNSTQLRKLLASVMAKLEMEIKDVKHKLASGNRDC